MACPFVERHQADVAGMVSCFDRVVLTGSLPDIGHSRAMESWLRIHQVRLADYPRRASCTSFRRWSAARRSATGGTRRPAPRRCARLRKSACTTASTSSMSASGCVREPPKSAGSIDIDVSERGSIAAISNEPGRAETKPVSHVTPQILVVPYGPPVCSPSWLTRPRAVLHLAYDGLLLPSSLIQGHPGTSGICYGAKLRIAPTGLPPASSTARFAARQRPSFDRRLTNLVSVGIQSPRGARRYSQFRGPEHRRSDEMLSNQTLHHDDHLFHQFTGWSEATVRRCRSCVYDNFQIVSLPSRQVAFPYHCGEAIPETSRILTKGQGHYPIHN